MYEQCNFPEEKTVFQSVKGVPYQKRGLKELHKQKIINEKKSPTFSY